MRNAIANYTSSSTSLEKLSDVGGIYASFILAKNAKIKFLTNNELTVLDSNNDPVAGITGGGGNANNSKRVRIWAGDSSLDSNGNLNLTNAAFRVYNDGSLIATSATITGTVYADNGHFAGELRAATGTFVGSVNIGNGKILLNSDGSGHVANGNIRWLADGTVYVKNAHITDSIIDTGDENIYEDTASKFEVQFFNVPSYSNGVVSNIVVQVKALENYQGTLSIQAGFDGQNGAWSAVSNLTVDRSFGGNAVYKFAMPDATAQGSNLNASMTNYQITSINGQAPARSWRPDSIWDD